MKFSELGPELQRIFFLAGIVQQYFANQDRYYSQEIPESILRVLKDYPANVIVACMKQVPEIRYGGKESLSQMFHWRQEAQLYEYVDTSMIDEEMIAKVNYMFNEDEFDFDKFYRALPETNLDIMKVLKLFKRNVDLGLAQKVADRTYDFLSRVSTQITPQQFQEVYEWICKTKKDYDKDDKRLPELNWRESGMLQNLAKNIYPIEGSDVDDFVDMFLDFKRVRGRHVEIRENLGVSLLSHFTVDDAFYKGLALIKRKEKTKAFWQAFDREARSKFDIDTDRDDERFEVTENGQTFNKWRYKIKVTSNNIEALKKLWEF